MEDLSFFEGKRLTEKLPLEAFKSTSEVKEKLLLGRYRRTDPELCEYIKTILGHPLFKSLMISTIALNAIFLVIETDFKVRYESFYFLEIADLIILAIYTTEFLLNLYLDPIDCWKDGYKRYDAFVLFLAYMLYVIDRSNPQKYRFWNLVKGFQALRILKLVYYSTGMTVLMTALRKTVKNVIYVLVLLFLLIFIFAILGHGLYGDPDTGDAKNWGDLPSAFFTLFSLVTVDGWTDLQEELDNKGLTSSRAFTIVFILLGFFVFFNMFIGVVIMDIQDTTEEYERKLQAEMRATLHTKKQAILRRQQEEISALINQQKSSEYKTFNELVEDFKKTLHHSDPMILEEFCASIPFIDLYLTSLDRQDATVFKLQELYYEIVATLTTLLKESEATSWRSLQSLRSKTQQPE
ncbi:cation channel sperm-associated protein 3 [Heteronotia binoei]|uniref:cation channel sperm-associated protein 3 n=1 Tax=Heteronotia binoei TaxID=13085 RepID=UPI00292FFDD6|nr:cation channel sperm-associated protein 3 [Heteronotia binoei]